MAAQEDIDIKNAFLKAALDCIITIDGDGEIVEFNPSAEKTFAYTKEEVLGKEMAELFIPPRYRNAHREGLKRHLLTGENKIFDQRLELTALRRNGEEFPIELAITKLQEAPPLFTAFIRDITERKQNEESRRRAQEELEKRFEQRTNELFKSEQRFRLMVAAVKDYSILMLDANGFIVTWNEGVRRLKGYTASEIVGQHFSKFYSDIDKKNRKPEYELQEARRVGRFEDEGFRVRKDGSTFWANVVITALHDESGLLIGFSKVTRDLTVRKKFEDDLEVQVKEQTQKLAQSRDQLDIILKGIGDGITVLDTSGKFIYANEKGANMCGLATVADFLAASSEQILDQFEIRDEFGKLFPTEKLPGRQALQGVENPPETVVRVRNKKTNEERWSLIRANPIFDENKKVQMAVSIFKDFTDRRHYEDATKCLDEVSRILISSLDYKQTLQQVAKLVIPRIADWCKISLISEQGDTPWIVANEHVNSEKLKLIEAYRINHPDFFARQLESTNVMRSGESEIYTNIATELLQKYMFDDQHLQFASQLGLQSAMIVPLRSRGKIFGQISFFSSESGRQFGKEDLFFAEELARRASISMDNAILFSEAETERKNHLLALEKMEKLAEVAESANQAKSLFLANMSHEIRTPLGAILGFTEFLNDPNLSSIERMKYTNIIHRNGQLLTQIIDDILDLSKVEAGHLDVEIIEISILNLLSDLSAVMNLRAEEKGLKFSIHTDRTVPAFIYSDPTRLRQILINLIGNAIKFTEKGEVKVTVTMSADQKLNFYVEDTGHGILPVNRERMFEWFTQADSSTTRKFGGTGLGLALSRRLARALGGDIVLLESSAAGTKFIVSVVASLQNQKDGGTSVKNLDHSVKKNFETMKAKSPLAGVRVLLVDDSDDNRILIETILVRKGLQVETAVNGQQGLELALAKEFDIILMDMQMPVLDGFQATAELRRRGYKKPILALTAHAMKEEREKTKAAGCDAHLTKPIDVQQLIAMISYYSPNNNHDLELR